MANKNSNWPTANQPDIKPEKMAQQIQAMEKLRELPQINHADSQEVERRIKYFFNFCVENELRPTVELDGFICWGIASILVAMGAGRERKGESDFKRKTDVRRIDGAMGSMWENKPYNHDLPVKKPSWL